MTEEVGKKTQDMADFYKKLEEASEAVYRNTVKYGLDPVASEALSQDVDAARKKVEECRAAYKKAGGKE